MSKTLLAQSATVELVIDAQHFRKIVLEGICKASVSVDIMTAVGSESAALYGVELIVVTPRWTVKIDSDAVAPHVP